MFRMRLERAEVVRPLPRVWSVGHGRGISRGSAGGRLSYGRSRPNITHAVGYGCQQRQICSPSDYRSGHGKRRAARYRVFRIRPCARRWRGAGFSDADSGRTGYRQVDIAVADGRQYRARCSGGQYVPRGRSAVCPTVEPGAGRHIRHGVDTGQHSINARQHRAVHFRRGITGAGSFARFPHQRGGAELVTGLHHRPVHSIGADRTEQAGLGHCGFGANHRLAGGRWHFRRFDSGARSGKRADRYR